MDDDKRRMTNEEFYALLEQNGVRGKKLLIKARNFLFKDLPKNKIARFATRYIGRPIFWAPVFYFGGGLWNYAQEKIAQGFAIKNSRNLSLGNICVSFPFTLGTSYSVQTSLKESFLRSENPFLNFLGYIGDAYWLGFGGYYFIRIRKWKNGKTSIGIGPTAVAGNVGLEFARFVMHPVRYPKELPARVVEYVSKNYPSTIPYLNQKGIFITNNPINRLNTDEISTRLEDN